VAETRVLLLSNRDPQDLIDEPPLEHVVSSGRVRAVRQDSLADAAAYARVILGAAPGVRVTHRPVFRPSEVLAAVGDHRPDVIFNMCESLGGDSRLEVTAAWLMQRLGLAFTGSPYFALRHCLYKVEANHILARAGVRVPATVRVDSPDQIPRVSFPVIVKPEREDGSLGIGRQSVVHDLPSLREQVALVIETCKQPAVVQRYIHGRELGVALLGWPVPRVLPLGEITFHDLPADHPHILTFESKWKPESDSYGATPSVPAVLRPLEFRRVAAIGRRAFEVLGLCDYGRVDVRLDESGTPYVIDVNPNCDISSDAGFALAARRAGISYTSVLWEILQCAIRRRASASFLSGSRGRLPRASVSASASAAARSPLPEAS
jgi:D-alanine-D-alanine ligase